MKGKIILVILVSISSVLCAPSQKKQEAYLRDPEYHLKLGFVRFTNGDYDQAIKAFDQALSLDPRHFLAMDYLGLAYFAKGNYQKSLEYFQKCLEINPKFTDVHNNLGMVYQEMGFIDKSVEEYQKALADVFYPTKEKPYFNLAKLSFELNKTEEALGFIQDAIRENSNFANAHNLKGLILEKLNNFAEAVECYEQAAKLIPQNTSFRFNLAVALLKNGELTRAREVFQKILSETKDPKMKEKVNEYLKMIEKKS